MTPELPPILDDSRIVSLVSRLAGDDAPSRVLSAGSLVMVLLSAVGSAIAYGVLPERTRIHWTLGTGPYYGPEFAPTPLVVTLFPVLVAVTAVLACALDALLRDTPEFGAVRPYYLVAMLCTLGVLLGSQMLLVVVNL